ncbi:MAG: DUF4870 domain-containing protein [Brachymonas sp.]|nr:DUF4870 domain-containing protein [Brachymonas sp.]
MQSQVSKESRHAAVMGWVGSIFFGFVPGLIIYLKKEHDAYVKNQAKEMLNWSITVSLVYCVCAALSFAHFWTGFWAFSLAGVVHLGFCIMGAMAASNGKDFKTPCTLRLIQ